MPPQHCTADKGYVGLGNSTYPIEEALEIPVGVAETIQTRTSNVIQDVIERSIAHLKVWQIFSAPSTPQITTIRTINVA